MEKTFFFLIVLISNLSCSNNTLIDERDDNVYNTIRIGNKIWMLENLNYNMDNQGSFFYPNSMLNIDSDKLNEALDFYEIDKLSIAGLSDTSVLKRFNFHLDSIMKKYPKGWRYYTLEASRKACPEGWRIPNNEDWLELNSYSETNEIAKLQLDWIGLWSNQFNPILDIRLGDYFGDERGCAYWSSTEYTNEFYLVRFSNDHTIIIDKEKIIANSVHDMNQLGVCIRCIKDAN